MIDPGTDYEELVLRLAVPVSGGVCLDACDLAAYRTQSDLIEPRWPLLEGMDPLVDELVGNGLSKPRSHIDAKTRRQCRGRGTCGTVLCHYIRFGRDGVIEGLA